MEAEAKRLAEAAAIPCKGRVAFLMGAVCADCAAATRRVASSVFVPLLGSPASAQKLLSTARRIAIMESVAAQAPAGSRPSAVVDSWATFSQRSRRPTWSIFCCESLLISGAWHKREVATRPGLSAPGAPIGVGRLFLGAHGRFLVGGWSCFLALR